MTIPLEVKILDTYRNSDFSSGEQYDIYLTRGVLISPILSRDYYFPSEYVTEDEPYKLWFVFDAPEIPDSSEVAWF